MKGLDTNVLVRFLVNDEPRQSRAAQEVFRKAEQARESLFISNLVVLESIWVLESAYGVGREALLETLAELLMLPIIQFEDRALIQAALIRARAPGALKVDLSDLFIGQCAIQAGCTATLTFDKQAARLAEFELLT